MVVFYFVLGYLSGSIPFGYIITRLVKHSDIREYGSHNIGATNVKRVLGLKWAIITFLLDALKGAVPVYFYSRNFNEPTSLILAISPFIGHCYTIWLKGKGGKGVATSAGILFILIPKIFTILLLLWFIIVKISGKSSPGALIAAVILPLVVYFTKNNINLTVFTTILSSWVILRHRENIKRLIKGEENRL